MTEKLMNQNTLRTNRDEMRLRESKRKWWGFINVSEGTKMANGETHVSLLCCPVKLVLVFKHHKVLGTLG